MSGGVRFGMVRFFKEIDFSFVEKLVISKDLRMNSYIVRFIYVFCFFL